MKKYLRVFRQACGNAISYLFAYRVDVILKIFVGLGWTLVSIGMAELFFLHTTALNGWTKSDVILLFFTWNLAFELGIALGRQIQNLDADIRLGRFDAVITKPIDAQFLAVFRGPDFTNLIYLLSRSAPYLWILARDGQALAWRYLPLYILLVIEANIIALTMRTMLMTINFWKERLDNLTELQNTVFQFGAYPISIFPKPLQIIFMTVLPLGFIATVPADVLRGNINWPLIALSVAVTILFLLAARLLWNKAIKNYTSASS